MLALDEIGRAEQDQRRGGIRLGGEEALQVLDGRLDGALLDVQLGQAQHGAGESGGEGHGLLSAVCPRSRSLID